MEEKWIVKKGNPYTKNKVIGHFEGLDESKSWEIECKEIKDVRTAQQRKAIEVYCKLLANALTDAGYDIQQTLAVSAPWTQALVKELIWKPVMKSQFDKASTTRLAPDEVSKIYDILNRHFIKTRDLYVPFPDRGGDVLG